MEFDRTAQIREPGRLGELGRFPMTLASEGEAADGHILRVAGIEVGEHLPLLDSHQNESAAILGSIGQMRADGSRFEAVGEIELDGEGERADIRRDVFHMVEQGHLRAVSLRWMPLEAVPRIELPQSHPAHVGRNEADPRRRLGVFFNTTRALEGSLTPVGSDPKSLTARSLETTGVVRDHWQRWAFLAGVAESDPFRLPEAFARVFGDELVPMPASPASSPAVLELEDTTDEPVGTRFLTRDDVGAALAEILERRIGNLAETASASAGRAIAKRQGKL